MIKELNKQTIERIKYPVRILQFGEGNFLRAFVDWMIDKANDAGVMNHGIVAVQPIAQGLANSMKRQDCLYHVYLEGIKEKAPIREISLIQSIQDIINPYEEYNKYKELFLSDGLEMIISNTTEAGIRYEEGDDLTAEPPKSFPAKMTALLYERFKKYQGAKDKGLLIICCELIENNGSTLLQYILEHAKYNKLEEEFINWVNTACHFYDTLVDRIVTGFPKATINEVRDELGYNDNLVVKGEYFHIWAIGGDPIIKEKLPLDKAGLNVLFMDDITAFRKKKVRILNGAHTAMVPVALQLGCQTVLDAFSDPLVEKYINKMIDNEVLSAIEGDKNELDLFASQILDRFYNPYIEHFLKDISLNSLSKWETRNFPTLKDNYELNNKLSELTAFSLAALLVLYSSSGIDFQPSDNTEFINFIQSSFDRKNLTGWVSNIVNNRQMWTENLSEIEGFIPFVSEQVQSILDNGMQQALQKIIEQ